MLARDCPQAVVTSESLLPSGLYFWVFSSKGQDAFLGEELCFEMVPIPPRKMIEQGCLQPIIKDWYFPNWRFLSDPATHCVCMQVPNVMELSCENWVKDQKMLLLHVLCVWPRRDSMSTSMTPCQADRGVCNCWKFWFWFPRTNSPGSFNNASYYQIFWSHLLFLSNFGHSSDSHWL